LKIHHNHKAAEIFSDASKQFNNELEIVIEHTQNRQISNIPPWEKPYPEYTHPSLLLLDAHYLMSESEAYKIVDAMVKIHQGFYIYLRNESTRDSVISLVDKLVNTMGNVGGEYKIDVDCID
ncbi:MAG: hypothetical protein HKP62_05680, partial [Sulfurovum sp.]|nr:hypothetical protein [Sulfurovum sp.]NNJ45487.1 hypothetical protein [Sulfurovum sp.]